jgi:uncharacterized membrane protein
MSGQGTNWQSKAWGWLVVALAFALVANLVWTMLAPLIVPAALLIVAVVVVITLLRWWKHRYFW